MDNKFVKPFIMAARNIIDQTLDADPQFDKAFLKQSPFIADDLLVMIGITGIMNGKIMVTADKESCLSIARKMSGGKKMEFDEIAKSAIGELCNMILGSTATIYANQGLHICITSPTIIEGCNIKVSQKEEILCVPIKIADIGELVLNISAVIS